MSHSLRVVHLLSGDLWAGAEAATFHLVCALAERPEVDVRVVSLNAGSLVDRFAAAGVPVRVESEQGRGFLPLLRALRRELDGADLVHAHRYKEDLLAAFAGRPWIATQHGRPEPRRGVARARALVVNQLARWVQRRSARRVIAVSSEVEAWLAPRVGAERCIRVWNGIADPAASIAPTAWPERPRRVGVLGRLVPVKAFDLAVDAVAACPGLELEIVGEGPERSTLERRIASHGAQERIRLVGHEAHPLPRVARWRALLVTSLHEGNPVGVLEALALGTPVLSADLAGVAEILEGDSGWLQSGRNPDDWGKTLERIINDHSGGEAASASARRRYLEAFTAGAAAERTVAIYREAIAPASAPPSRA